MLMTVKYKERVSHWVTSYFPKRHMEVTIARLRLNCIKGIHLVPHIENTFPLTCTCDDSRLTLHHLFFSCDHYVMQRAPLLQYLRDNDKAFLMKNVVDDDFKLCELVYRFLSDINYLTKV